MAKFKVGDLVEDYAGSGAGIISNIYEDGLIEVRFQNEVEELYCRDGKAFDDAAAAALRLTGRPFNVGDKVVIGGEKGVVCSNKDEGHVTGIRISMLRSNGIGDSLWITTDGRAWPGTPIIAEHDWEEESATIDVSDYKSGVVVNSETENHAAEAIEYLERNKGVDISPGFAKDWPIDNGIEDVTVSPEEVWHIAEMQDIDELEYRKTPKYIKMALALALEGIEVDLKTADLIREIVDGVNAHGGQYDLDTSCNIHQRIEEKYV